MNRIHTQHRIGHPRGETTSGEISQLELCPLIEPEPGRRRRCGSKSLGGEVDSDQTRAGCRDRVETVTGTATPNLNQGLTRFQPELVLDLNETGATEVDGAPRQLR